MPDLAAKKHGRKGNQNARKHGYSQSATYKVWLSMRVRCRNPNDKNYRHYGGRGITVCKRWDSFPAFIKDMGDRPSPKHTIERIKNHLGYSPGNCCWATRAEQGRNTRRTRNLTHDGRTMCLEDWARETGLNRGTINSRLEMGFTVAEALTLPTSRPRNHIGKFRSKHEST